MTRGAKRDQVFQHVRSLPGEFLRQPAAQRRISQERVERDAVVHVVLLAGHLSRAAALTVILVACDVQRRVEPASLPHIRSDPSTIRRPPLAALSGPL